MQTAPSGLAKTPEKSGDGLVLTALMLGILLAALDQTVVGTSLGKIVADIGGFEHFTWLFAAYMLASTVVIPLAGKFSDLFGRRPVYLIGMGIFLLGSILCGTATSMTQLIIYRGIQGLGGGVLFPVAIATVADLYPPSERGRVQGAFGAVFGLSSVVGPFLGGWLVDNAHILGVTSWRWVFYVNVPVGIVAMTMVSLHFPRTGARGTAPIDWAGIGALTLGLVSLLLITVWGGDTYAWASAQILGLVALTAASLIAFVLIERRAKDPVIPLSLFKNSVFTVGAIATLLMGVGMFTVISFMPTYMQGVVGISATYSGTALIPLSLALVAGSIVSGRLTKKLGYKIWTILGTMLAAIGFFLLMRLAGSGIPPVWLAVIEMVVVGLGLGFTIQSFMVAAQNATERRQAGVVSSTYTLFRTLGATLGVAAFGAVLNRRLQAEIPAHVDNAIVAGVKNNPFIAGHTERIPSLLLQPGFHDQLVASLQAFLGYSPEAAPGAADAAIYGIKIAYSNAIEVVFLAGAVIVLLAFVTALFLKSIPMKSAEEYLAGGKGDAASAPTMGH